MSAPLKNPVIFLDSGIGGLPYLQHFRKLLPEQDCLYYADTANFPYGTKSEKTINALLEKTMEKLIRLFSPSLVVIACNTASVTGLSYLRSRFDIPFIGVVPAVKPAAEKSVSGRIGVLATSQTINNDYLDNLIRDFAPDCQVERYGDPDVVEIVEHADSISPEKRKNVLQKIKDYFTDHPIDYLVLACTHFVHLGPELNSLLGPGIRLIDSREGVARQTIRILYENNLYTPNKGRADFYTSSGSDDFPYLEKLAGKFNLEFRGHC